LVDRPDLAFRYRAFRCPDYRCLVFLYPVFLFQVCRYPACRYPACLYRVYPCLVCPYPDFLYPVHPYPVYPCPACRCRACLCLDCRAVPVYLVLCRADLDSVLASVLWDSVEPADEFRVCCPVPTAACYRVGSRDVADDNCSDDNANCLDIRAGLPTR
jgi:hypothetical protein